MLVKIFIRSVVYIYSVEHIVLIISILSRPHSLHWKSYLDYKHKRICIDYLISGVVYYILDQRMYSVHVIDVRHEEVDFRIHLLLCLLV